MPIISTRAQKTGAGIAQARAAIAAGGTLAAPFRRENIPITADQVRRLMRGESSSVVLGTTISPAGYQSVAPRVNPPPPPPITPGAPTNKSVSTLAQSILDSGGSLTAGKFKLEQLGDPSTVSGLHKAANGRWMYGGPQPPVIPLPWRDETNVGPVVPLPPPPSFKSEDIPITQEQEMRLRAGEKSTVVFGPDIAPPVSPPPLAVGLGSGILPQPSQGAPLPPASTPESVGAPTSTPLGQLNNPPWTPLDTAIIPDNMGHVITDAELMELLKPQVPENAWESHTMRLGWEKVPRLTEAAGSPPPDDEDRLEDDDNSRDVAFQDKAGNTIQPPGVPGAEGASAIDPNDVTQIPFGYPPPPTGDVQSRNEYWYARTGGVDYKNPYPSGIDLPPAEGRQAAYENWITGGHQFLSKEWFDTVETLGFDPITGAPLNPDPNDNDRWIRIYTANGVGRGETFETTLPRSPEDPVDPMKPNDMIPFDNIPVGSFEDAKAMYPAEFTAALLGGRNGIEWWDFVSKTGFDPIGGVAVDKVTGDPTEPFMPPNTSDFPTPDELFPTDSLLETPPAQLGIRQQVALQNAIEGGPTSYAWKYYHRWWGDPRNDIGSLDYTYGIK